MTRQTQDPSRIEFVNFISWTMLSVSSGSKPLRRKSLGKVFMVTLGSVLAPLCYVSQNTRPCRNMASLHGNGMPLPHLEGTIMPTSQTKPYELEKSFVQGKSEKLSTSLATRCYVCFAFVFSALLDKYRGAGCSMMSSKIHKTHYLDCKCDTCTLNTGILYDLVHNPTCQFVQF